MAHGYDKICIFILKICVNFGCLSILHSKFVSNVKFSNDLRNESPVPVFKKGMNKT